MSGFSAEWLALREPADWRARSRRVTDAVVRALDPGRIVRAIDLAAGTGSNTRFLARTLPATQEWLLIDHDAELLERWQRTIGFNVRTRVVDLSRTFDLTELLAARNLVTAAALLDLVSDEWLKTVCAACHRQRSVVLFALSYDGRIVCSPQETDDELVRNLVNRHQQTDKGFGRALGPDAGARAAEVLENLGYQVVRERSDWVLDRESPILQRQLIEGWAAAAAEMAPADAHVINYWRQLRIDHVTAERSHIVVGHEDVGAFMA